VPFAFIFFSALVPSLLLVGYFHSRDAYPEPPRVLWTVFVLGVSTVLPVVLVAWSFDALLDQLSSPLVYGFASAFVQAAIPEAREAGRLRVGRSKNQGETSWILKSESDVFRSSQ